MHNKIEVNSYGQKNGITAGMICNNSLHVIDISKKEKLVRWGKLLGAIASIVTILGYFSIKIKGGV